MHGQDCKGEGRVGVTAEAVLWLRMTLDVLVSCEPTVSVPQLQNLCEVSNDDELAE